MIPLFHPPKQNVEKMISEIRDTLTGRWWGQGPKVDLFEKKFGEKFGFKYCVMTNSGTMALQIAIKLAGLKPHERVVVPVFGCTATCHAILNAEKDAEIEFADIRQDTLTLDPDDLKWRGNGKLRVLIPVHLGGLVTDGYKIRRMAKHHGAKIIEDACQALGARNVGYGDYVAFSFQAIKNLTTGDGGMLIVKKKTDYLRAKKLRWFSIDREQKKRANWQAYTKREITSIQEEVGYKGQPTDIAASIGLVALMDFDENLRHRHRLVNIYRKELEKCQNVTLLKRGVSADWLFMVLVNGDRDRFAEKLKNAGIETNTAHARMDVHPAFQTNRATLPNMDAIENRYLCLPLNNYVSEEDVRYICKVIKEMR